MGRPKLTLPWGRTTILGHLILQWNEIGATQIAAVCATTNSAVTEELDRLAFPLADRIINPNPEQGMFSSVTCAARWSGWNPSLTHWLLTLGDQPHLHNEILRGLIDFAS